MSGQIVVASGRELIRTKKRININGQEIDPETKKVIEPLETPYVPTPDEMAAAQKKSQETKEKLKEDPSNGLESIIAKKLGEKIGNAIGKALENMDLDKLIGDAVDKALKK